MRRRKIAFLLALCLAISLFAAFPAMADETEEGSGTLTVIPRTDVPHSYEAYRLLKGEVLSENTLWQVQFGDGITTDLLDMLEFPEDERTAEHFAEWLQSEVLSDVSQTFAIRLALCIYAEGSMSAYTKFLSGDTVTLPDGYYLLVSDDAQPMIVLVGGGLDIVINEKSIPPYLDKVVGEVERKTGEVSYGKAADSGKGYVIPYKLIGTLPSNYNSFEKYTYIFCDSFDECIVIDTDSTRAFIYDSDGNKKKNITKYADIEYTNTSMTVTFEDLKQAYPEYTDGDTVVIYYETGINDHATMGKNSNDNTAYLKYTRSPTSEFLGQTTPVDCRVYTWQIVLRKVDASTKRSLTGAVFTIQDVNGWYVNRDGSVTSDKTEYSEWTTDRTGKITVSRVDSGLYTLREVVTPGGYIENGVFAIELKADYSDPDLIYFDGKTAGDCVSMKTIDGRTGVIEIEVTNTKIPGTIKTGDENKTLLYLILAGAALAIGISAAFCIVKRKKKLY